MIGQTLNNRYRIIKFIGQGGCGETYIAEDTHLPSFSKCVVKKLKPASNNSPEVHQLIAERFQREAVILEKLGKESNQIPKLYAYFEEAGEFYIVQEFIDGDNLAKKISVNGVMTESEVRLFLTDFLPVLEKVHAQKIIHRDIDPSNIIIRNKDNKPVLIDFGTIKEAVTLTIDPQGNLTTTIIAGKPGYMAIEQAAGKPVIASDLFSLGYTTIYALTGKKPEQLYDITSGQVEWHKFSPNVSQDLAQILDKIIQIDFRNRFATAREMFESLQKTVTAPTIELPSNNIKESTVTLQSDIKASKNKSIFPAILATSALIAVIAICGILLSSNNSQQKQAQQSTNKSDDSVNVSSTTQVELPINNSTQPPKPVEDDKVFKNGSPYPSEFEQYKIGTRISVLMSAYPEPNGELSSSFFRISKKEGVFDYIYFHFNADKIDPQIQFINYSFRDEKAKNYVRDEALTVFGSEKATRRLFGRMIEWENIKGVRVKIDDDGYTVSNTNLSIVYK